MNRNLIILYTLVVILTFLALVGCTFNSKGTIKAIYLVPQSGGQLTDKDLKRHSDIAVINTFDELKETFSENTSIWIDKDAIDLLDQSWLHEEPQNYATLVVIGYNDALYSFREALSGFGIEGPSVNWSQEDLEPGFSIWILREKTDTSQSSFMEGYDIVPTVEQILSSTNALLENEE